GQRQFWFLMRFMGTDADINIETDHQEFRSWKWTSAETLEGLIVPFKRRLYRAVVEEFRPLI
ncbi:MAG: RNA pyrophosphohydrolase, partial [Blastomonas fulva]